MPRDIQQLLKRKINREEFIRKMVEKAPRRKPVRARVPAGRRGTLFAIRNKRLAIREGALRKVQIVITYVKTTTRERKDYVVAPYSWRYRRLRVGRRKMLFAYDMKDKHIKGFALRNIRNVAITDRKYRPKWPVEIA
jgi:predicted DNA-binding transcriptional regulator YafY